MSAANGTRGDTIAVAGASGFIGSRLVPGLLRDGWKVRCLSRDPSAAARLLPDEAELAEVDLEVSDGRLEEALEGCRHAYFLVHLIGTGDDYTEREEAAAAAFGKAAKEAGVDGVSYLGGLGDHSPHLAARAATARALGASGPPTIHFRAGMVIGPGSESYELLRALVDKIRLSPLPRRLMQNHTQPIGARDVVAYLRAAPRTPEAAGRDVEIGCPEALTYRELIDALAIQLGRSAPRWLEISDELGSPGVLAAAAATVTRGSPEIAAELALGLSAETVVTDPSGAALFDVRPESLAVALQRCLEEEERRERVHG